MKTGTEIIADERARQVAKEGYDALHDAAHQRGELLAAAMCYTSVPLLRLCYKGYAAEGQITEMMATSWPWDEEWWKPDNDAVRNLAKAGALIAAEIDRLQAMQKLTEAVQFNPGARGLADACRAECRFDYCPAHGCYYEARGFITAPPKTEQCRCCKQLLPPDQLQYHDAWELICTPCHERTYHSDGTRKKK